MRWLALAAVGLTLTACDPSYIETSAEVDMYLSQARFRAVCVALENDNEDSLRQYATEKLVQHPEDSTATSCVCDAVLKYAHGKYDPYVVDGMKDSHRDDMVACALPALDVVETVEDRIRLVAQLAAIGAPSGYAKVGEIAQDLSQAPKVRAVAVTGLLPVRDDHIDLLLGRLTDDPDPVVRAEAALVFENATQDNVVAALVKAAREDSDGGVRAAALKAVVKLRIEETDQMVCDMMMNDPDERVRDRAVRSFKGSKRPEALACLTQRLRTKEDSAIVRESTLKALYASPSDQAPKVLCDAIGPWTRMYVDTLPVHKMDGVDIIKHHNNRDFENSYTCVQKALAQGGYSCWGRYYLASRFIEFGGKAFKPTCQGMESAEIIME